MSEHHEHDHEYMHAHGIPHDHDHAHAHRHTHTHALYAFMEDGRHRVRGGHLKSSTVLYTAEIELRPVPGEGIGYRRDPETGTGFWRFADE